MRKVGLPKTCVVLPVFVETFVWLSHKCHTTQTQFQHIWIARSAFGDIFRDGQQAGCSLLPVPRTEEQRRRRRRIFTGHCFSFSRRGRLRSQEEEDFFILSERNTSTFSFSRIRRFRLLHSQEEEDFISSKRRTLLDLVSHSSRIAHFRFSGFKDKSGVL